MKAKAFSKRPMVKELAKAGGIPAVQASFIFDLMMDIMVKKIKRKARKRVPGTSATRMPSENGKLIG